MPIPSSSLLEKWKSNKEAGFNEFDEFGLFTFGLNNLSNWSDVPILKEFYNDTLWF